MGGRIDVRADTAIAGTAGACREWPGLRRKPAGGLMPPPGTVFAWALCRGRLGGAAPDEEQ